MSIERTIPLPHTVASDYSISAHPLLTVSNSIKLEGITDEDVEVEADMETDLPDPFLSVLHLPAGAMNVSKEIGHGAFGQVYQGQWGDRLVALKKINLDQAKKSLPGVSEAEILESLQWEVSRLSTVSHPNLVQFYGVYQSAMQSNMPVSTYLAMEFCEGGMLQHTLEKGDVLWSTRWQWALEITQGLAYLHHQGVLHRDLKAENVLLDRHGCAKLADLGVAQVDALLQVHEATVVAQGLQDKRFIAPENLENPTLSTQATDVYALGLVFWQLVSGKKPRHLQELSPSELQIWMERGLRESIPDDCPDSFRALILACWQKDPAKRPSAEHLVGQLNELATAFHPHSVEMKVCEQLDTLIHLKRQEGLAYVVPFVTAHRVDEPLDTYWQRWESSSLTEQTRLNNPPLSLVDTFQDFIHQPGSGTLLLLGESGLGKTLSVYQWADHLLAQWRTYLSVPTSTESPPYLPLFIRPVVVGYWTQRHLCDAFSKALAFYGLSPNTLMPLLLIIDGYDECQLDEGPCNIADQMGLPCQGPNPIKLIITCRPDTVATPELTQRFACHGQLHTRYFLPFRVDQILAYLKDQLVWTEETHAQYQAKLAEAQQLRTVLRNPFVLSLLVQSWESVSKKNLNQLDRWQIYEGFIEHGITTRRVLLSKHLQRTLMADYPSLLDSFHAFASSVAFTAFQHGHPTLSWEAAVQSKESAWMQLENHLEKDSRRRFAMRQKILAEQKGQERRALLNEDDYVAIMKRYYQQFV